MSNPIEAARHLLSLHATLSSITEAAKWRSETDSILASLVTTDVSAQEQTTHVARQASDLRIASREKSFFGRFFKSADEKAVQTERSKLQRTSELCRSLVADLQEKADDTPSARDEQAQLIKELKLRKKDLQLQKKEVNAEMKNIRTVARQKSANAATSLTTLFVGQKYTAAERRSIRYSKEQALTPHEDARVAIDRQILALERQILRMESYQ
jgi:hypothetical protein